MARAPVYYALAQVRFNAVLALDQYIPAIQDSLRKAGYPDFEKSFMAMLNLNMGAAPPEPSSVPALQPQARYNFLNESRTVGFLLDQSMMVFRTTDYDNFDPFSEKFLEGLEFVHNAAGLNYSERIGIRFLDAVCPGEGETLSQYLIPSVLGLLDKLNPRDLVYVYSETRTKEGNTMLVSRATIFNQDKEGAAFPPDLQPVNMNLIERFSKVRGLYAVIDTDSWLETREKFDIGGLEKRLRLLHDDLRRSFDAMVTPHALSTWNSDS